MDDKLFELQRKIEVEPYNASLFREIDRVLRRAGALQELESIDQQLQELHKYNYEVDPDIDMTPLRLDIYRIQREKYIPVLKSLHPRIRRSKRKDFWDLAEWAKQVVAEEGIDFNVEKKVLRPYRIEIDEISEASRNEIIELTERRKDLIFYMWPQKGSKELEWERCDTSTYSTQSSPGYYVTMCVKGELARSKALGFDSTTERESRPRMSMAHRWATASYFVKIKTKLDSELEAQILKQKSRYFRDFFFDVYKEYTDSLPERTRRYGGAIGYEDYIEEYGAQLIGL